MLRSAIFLASAGSAVAQTQEFAGHIFSAIGCDPTGVVGLSLMSPGCFEVDVLSEKVTQGGVPAAPTWSTEFFEAPGCPTGTPILSFPSVPSDGTCTASAPPTNSALVIPVFYEMTLYQDASCTIELDTGLVELGCEEEQGLSVGLSLSAVNPVKLTYGLYAAEGCMGGQIAGWAAIPIVPTPAFCLADVAGEIPAFIGKFTPLPAGALPEGAKRGLPALMKTVAAKKRAAAVLAALRGANATLSAPMRLAKPAIRGAQ